MRKLTLLVILSLSINSASFGHAQPAKADRDPDADLAATFASAAGSDDASMEARIAALTALTKLGPKAIGARDSLRYLLLHQPAKVNDYQKDLLVLHTAQALGAMGHGAFPAIKELAEVKVTDPLARKAIVAAMLAIGAPLAPASAPAPASSQLPATVDSLREWLKDPKDESRRLYAALSLRDKVTADLKDSSALLADLIGAMKDPNARVRDAARESAKQLVKVPDSAFGYVVALAEMLRDPDAGLRLQAARGLGGCRWTAWYALPFLCAALESDPDASVRHAAWLAIVEIWSGITPFPIFPLAPGPWPLHAPGLV
jgi:hypothetical protein